MKISPLSPLPQAGTNSCSNSVHHRWRYLNTAWWVYLHLFWAVLEPTKGDRLVHFQNWIYRDIKFKHAYAVEFYRS